MAWVPLRRHFWIAPARFAWRDIRASRLNSFLVVAALAVSTAGIEGVRDAANASREALVANSRQWLAADLSVNTKSWPSEAQSAALRQMGNRWTIVSSAMTMAASDQAPDAGVAAVKAVDPDVYPYYGSIDLKPGGSLKQVLTSDTVVVSADMLSQLNVRMGDSVRVGAQRFRIAGVIANEPDRFAGTPSIGMRCILSREGYIRSGVARAGNSELHRILIALPAGGSFPETRRRLEDLFPDADVLDYRDANRPAAGAPDMLTSSLGLTAFVSLALGVVGVVIAVREHVEQRINTLAVVRTLGGRDAQIALMMILQIAGMIVCAWLITIPLSWIVRSAVLSYAGGLLPLGTITRWNPGVFAESALACSIAAMPALIQPILMIRAMRPALILRKDAEPALPVHSRANRIAVVSAAIGLAAIAARTLGTWTSAALIVGSLAASLGGAWSLTATGLRALRRRTASADFCSGMPLTRLALRNLARYPVRSRLMIVALSMGQMTLVGSFAVDRTIAGLVTDSLPFDRANLFVADFNDSRRAGLLQFLSAQPGVEGPVEVMTLARLRLRNVNGRPVQGGAGGTWLVGCSDGRHGITVADDVARNLGLSVGSSIVFSSRDSSVQSTVVRIEKMPRLEKVWYSFRIDCPALAGQDLFHHAALRINPERVAAVRRSVIAQFPTLPVITGAELADTVVGAVDEEVKLVRTVAWFRIAAGLCVLIAVVSASRAARLREIGILASLGATHSKLIRIYTLEFAAIGLAAGLIGNVLAVVFTSVSLAVVFGRTAVAVEWRSLAVAILLAPAVTICAGWLPTWRLLDSRPMSILRRE